MSLKENYIPLGKFKQNIKQIESGGKIKRTIYEHSLKMKMKLCACSTKEGKDV